MNERTKIPGRRKRASSLFENLNGLLILLQWQQQLVVASIRLAEEKREMKIRRRPRRPTV